MDVAMTEDLLEAVIANPPQIHQGEAEIGNEKALSGLSLIGSSLAGHMREIVEKNLIVGHGIDSEVARFLHRTVKEGGRTLETGCGLSSIIFAIRKAFHTVITPSLREAAALREYAHGNHIDIEHLDFVLEPSEKYLPSCTLQDLDLVLIDGKHAVPWPFIDWFYTAEKLKVGGLCMIDDVHLESVLTLVKFLREDHPRWEFVWELPRRTVVFRKLSTTIHEVAWHQQPYISARYGRKGRLLNALGIKWRPKPKE
jgi:hypothetical protein